MVFIPENSIIAARTHETFRSKPALRLINAFLIGSGNEEVVDGKSNDYAVPGKLITGETQIFGRKLAKKNVKTIFENC